MAHRPPVADRKRRARARRRGRGAAARALVHRRGRRVEPAGRAAARAGAHRSDGARLRGRRSRSFSSVVCGLAPALRLARTDVQTGLRDGGRGSTGGGFRDRLRGGLIVARSRALAAAALRRRPADPQRHRAAARRTRVRSARRPERPDRAAAGVVRRSGAHRRHASSGWRRTAASIPGVSHAGAHLVCGDGARRQHQRPAARRRHARSISKNLIPSRLRMITPDFFQTMRIPIVKGRGFDANDRRDGQRVMIISETLAARAFPGQDPIGKRIGCCEQTPDQQPVWKVVVGVAGDVRSHGPGDRAAARVLPAARRRRRTTRGTGCSARCTSSRAPTAIRRR